MEEGLLETILVELRSTIETEEFQDSKSVLFFKVVQSRMVF